MTMASVAPTLLVVDDDERLRERLLRAFAARGLDVHGTSGADEALSIARGRAPSHAVIDLRMPGRSGIELLDELRGLLPALRAVVLTGYGSIATALASVRSGAVDYLAKPADADQILAALGLDGAGVAEPRPSAPASSIETPSLERVEWEHIQRVLSDYGGNISRAASVLGLHRRTLQRKLSTFPPRR
jgi:two-component system, response regulator RegA